MMGKLISPSRFDVEHGAVDPVRGDRAIGLVERRRRPDHGRAPRAQRLGEVGGEIGLVLDDQDADAMKILGAEAEQHRGLSRLTHPRRRYPPLAAAAQ